MAQETATLVVTSPAFEAEGSIPVKYTCDGESISPPLHMEDIPELAKSLVLIAEDPDAPKGVFDHWLVWEIDPTNHTLPENSVPGISGVNTAGKTGYHPPCPPSGSHRYYFHVFALSEHLDLPAGSNRKTLEDAMQPFIIAKGSIMGRFERQK
ncbi:MAG: YbhB/YbcL family Raf kinase inhibitor-like protein [Williamsia sp.]|nr:YbhB/YbcL family Raf kinase inhibitor-like protein [Williamsia sp.]